MTIEITGQGSLFSSDFLTETIQQTQEWQEFSFSASSSIEVKLRSAFDKFPINQNTNESQTEDDLIWPVLSLLGWTDALRQQNLSAKGRDDVPDGLLFQDGAAKEKANKQAQEWKRYSFGAAIVESKRWLRPLDRRSGKRGEETAPSTQMLRYLRRIDDVTSGSLRWGILTNGAKWRLYFSGARSVSEQFLELDLAQILNLPGHNDGLFRLSDDDRAHWLRVFVLMFRRQAFASNGVEAKTFHERAIAEGKFYEERVAEDLSKKVFEEVFPDLAQGIAKAAPDADLQDVRQGALILLYRLLFILYAEDRDLLPVKDHRYDDYGLRNRVRLDVRDRKDRGDVFSDTAARYWSAMSDLFLAIDKGDASIGLPPYNGGLFDQDRTLILTRIRLPDDVMARVIDALSFERTEDGRKYINYRNLSVQQLGSIYERLLEFDIARDGRELIVRPNIFARKGSGSYYTPDDLVQLILAETLEPLISSRKEAFRARIAELATSDLPPHRKIGSLKVIDPATSLLDLKVVDPAMGSGHFLVSLVDFMADQVIAAMAEAEAEVPEDWGDYASPLGERIDTIRNTILANAEARKWTIDEQQLDDRHVIRRMVLKRCIYGVDKNFMAVELAKVALWLHTFTVGAPLSFLDHHLRCGDSLFGSWVRAGIDKAGKWGSPLLLHDPIQRALRAASKMQIVEGLTDAEIAEAHRSADVFAEVKDMTAPLDALLSFIHALDWLNLKGKPVSMALSAFFDGEFGDPIEIVMGKRSLKRPKELGAGTKKQMSAAEKFDLFAGIFSQAQELVSEENFLNWQVAFPGIWSNWDAEGLTGGFDAVIGNPPWDRMKLQQVEWFAARRPEIAMVQRAADRARMIKALEAAGDPLAADFAKANARAEAASQMARKGGDYPLLSGGDTNLNSLFVERAARIVSPGGVVGLLIPSGIATEQTSQVFFSRLIEGQAASCYFDFFNKRASGPLFFPDVYYRFKFSVLVFSGGERQFPECRFATFVRDLDELNDPAKVFTMGLDHFRLVNPNSMTAPVYKASRDRQIATALYERLPVLVNRSDGNEVKTWPVKYVRMYDMANDSDLFRTVEELQEKEGAWPEGGGRWRSAAGVWVPLFEGKMVQAFDHRASGITTVAENLYRSGQAAVTSDEQRHDPDHVAASRYYVLDKGDLNIELAIKDVTSTTNSRSLIACIIPPVGAGHTLPVLRLEIHDALERATAQAILAATLNSTVVDFVARTKILSNHASWYVLEQLPVAPPEVFQKTMFGSQTAAEVIRNAVLELSYTAHDLAPFAKDLGYVDEAGNVLQPFAWDDARRLMLRAKLDAVFFHLYGITDRDEIRYIYSTFPIVEREEGEAFNGQYRSRELCLAYMNALKAGAPDAEIGL